MINSVDADAFHDCTLIGTAVLSADLDADTVRVHALIASAGGDEVIGGLLNVARYLLGIIRGETGAGHGLVLDEIRQHCVRELASSGPPDQLEQLGPAPIRLELNAWPR